jgi:hypothetical protein
MSRWLRGMFLLPLWLGFGAQAFEGVSYQGTLTDAAGDLLSSGRYTLEFNLYKTQSDSTPVWGPQVFDDGIGTPGHSYKVEVVDGMFSVVLGERDTQGRLLSEAFMKNAGFLLLGLKVDAGPEIQPRQQIMPAPYAFRALSAPLPRVAVVTIDPPPSPDANIWDWPHLGEIGTAENVPGMTITNLEVRPGEPTPSYIHGNYPDVERSEGRSQSEQHSIRRRAPYYCRPGNGERPPWPPDLGKRFVYVRIITRYVYSNTWSISRRESIFGGQPDKSPNNGQ